MFVQIGTGLKVFVFILVASDQPSLCVMLVSCLYQSSGKMGEYLTEVTLWNRLWKVLMRAKYKSYLSPRLQQFKPFINF